MMKRNVWLCALWMTQQGWAEAQAAPQPSMVESLIPFLFIFVAMYFILIRPQSRKAKEHASFLQELKAREEVVTTGGMIGRVRSVAPDFITLEAGGVSFKFLREHIQRLAQAPAGGEKKKA